MQKLLYRVREQVEDAEAKKYPLSSSFVELLNGKNGLPRCCAELESLKSKLETKLGSIDPAVQRWTLKDGEVKNLLEYLGQFQSVLRSASEMYHT